MYKVELKHIGEYAFSAKVGEQEILIDAKSQGLTPPALLLAALGSCIGVFSRKYAEGTKLELKDFTINVEAELSKEPPVSFREINVTISFKDNLDERRRKSLLEFVKNCPLHNTLKVIQK